MAWGFLLQLMASQSLWQPYSLNRKIRIWPVGMAPIFRTITIQSFFTLTPIIHLPIQLMGPTPVNEKCIRPLLLGTLAGFSGMAAKLADARLFLLFHTLL